MQKSNRFWNMGESEESGVASWSSFENRVELILKKRKTIHLD